MRIAWVTIGTTTDAVDRRTYPSDVVEHDGRLTSALASVRLRLLSPMAGLRARGHEVELLKVDSSSFDACAGRLRTFDAVVFKKTLERGQPVVSLFDRAVASVVTLFDLCDMRLDPATESGRQNRKMIREADRVVASTPALAEAVREMGARDIAVITDPYEGPRGEPAWRPKPDRLKALWFGNSSNVDTLPALMDELLVVGRRWPIQLTIMTSPASDLPRLCREFNQRWRHVLATRFEEWTLDATWRALAATDVVVIPGLKDAPSRLVKSPNRIVESLWAGRCVIANPLSAYLPFSDWAFIDDSIGRGLERALDGQDRIVERVHQAQRYIEDVHAPERVAAQWERAITEAIDAKGARAPVPSGAGSTAAPAPPRRLNLGCGDKILPGYVNVDVVESRAGQKPDVLCDLHRLTPFADESVDEVLAVHVVEHFWRWEVTDILKEWARVLKRGGKMVLECPNLLAACEAFLRDPNAGSGPGSEGQQTMWVFYGDPAWRDPLMIHRWGYTPRSLARVMEEAGLVNVRQEPAEFKLREPRDMRVVGEKP